MSGVPNPEVRVRRFQELDGLRGVAALVVLVYHGLLLTPAVSALYVPGGSPPEEGSTLWWLTYSPLKLFSSGPQAVIVFFVLSGFVLALPAFRGGLDWATYFPRRFVRIFLPVLGAVALACILIIAVPQNAQPSFSSWMNASVTPTLTLPQVFGALNLFNGDTHIVNPLWSIQWEMIFSFTLPLFILVAVVVQRWWALGLIFAVAIAAVGSFQGITSLMYLPVFLVGVLMAAGLDAMERWMTAINATRARALVWAALALLAAFFIIGPWLITGGEALDPLRSWISVLVPLGAALLVFCAIGSRMFARVLAATPLRFAGKISFSLYLVHAPVLIAVRNAVPGWPAPAAIAVGASAAVVIAILFHRVVEAPSHRASVLAGRWGRSVLQPENPRTPRVHPEVSQSSVLGSTGD